MRTGETEILDLIGEANFTKAVSNSLVDALRHEDMINYKGLRLLWFLKHVKGGTLNGLSFAERKEDIGHFCEVLKRGKREKVSDICFFFFEGKLRGERQKFFFPEKMIKKLIGAAMLEEDENIKEIIYYQLLVKEKHLAQIISPNELVFALWSQNPILRNNVIAFLLMHYQVDDILKAIVMHGEMRGEKLP